MKPVCVPCRRFFRPKKNGKFFVEGKPNHQGNNVPFDDKVGKRAPELWEAYKLWCGDLWHCPDCGAEIIVGVGLLPVSQDYLPSFKQDIAKTLGDEITINDC